jgi:hypothetical protein
MSIMKPVTPPTRSFPTKLKEELKQLKTQHLLPLFFL